MSERPFAQLPVVVAGGGWAGLACAFHLCRSGVPVILVEASRQLGGRARSIRFGDQVVDNGQHLLTGACHRILTLLEQLGIEAEQAFTRIPLTWHCIGKYGPTLRLKTPRLPAPLHLLGGILTARGLSYRDRMKALRFGRRLPTLEIPTEQDISVQALLRSEAQTAALTEKLWEPLCIATLNTGIGEASARVFVRLLRETFALQRRNSDLLIPRLELGNLLPMPCAEYLEGNGARVILGKRVTGLGIENGAVTGVSTSDQSLRASHVVLATPHVISRRLMSTQQALHSLCDKLAALGNEPVTTLYFKYPRNIRLPQIITALHGGIAQWVVDRSAGGATGLLAVVISAGGEHMRMSLDTLRATVVAELNAAFPDWPAPCDSLVIREKRATFRSRVGIDSDRPGNSTAVPGLWLAGDYTDTGLPATLESAVRSGIACAQGIESSLQP